MNDPAIEPSRERSPEPSRVAAPDAPLIRIRGVRKSYGELEVLRGLDLDVAASEKVAVIGASGSGKSTLLRILMTLEGIDSGRVELAGESVWTVERGGREVPADEAHLRRVRSQVGMVFQQFNLFPHMTVRGNVTEAPVRVRGMSRDAADEAAAELLDRVGLGDKLDAYPAQLSGGQQQRVAIARALAMEPEVMLFDEVTSGLDPELVGDVLGVLRRLAEESRMTMLFVTHQMGFARDIADRVVFMDAGRVAEDGPPKEIFKRPRLERTRVFLSRILAD